MEMLKDFAKSECGVSSLEYAIIASVLVVVLIVVLASIGIKVSNKMTSVNATFTGHAGYN